MVALQEIKRDLGGLRLLMQALGPNWGWILTDFTRGTAGNQERMGFVFDLRRVRPSGLAAELVVPIENETTLTEAGLKKQFARTPYAVSFESQGVTFTLVTLHVLWGSNAMQRLPEIKEIARWLLSWTCLVCGRPRHDERPTPSDGQPAPTPRGQQSGCGSSAARSSRT